MKFAQRIAHIEPFRVMEIIARAQALEADGYRVVHFEVGEPDFPTAAPIVAAGQAALAAGHTKYTVATGIPRLREKICAYYETIGVSVDPAQVIVTAGASAGLSLLAGLLLDPQDELLITDPGYPCNEVFVYLTAAAPSLMEVSAEQGFQPSLMDIQRHWGVNTRGVLLGSPANPTGALVPKQTLAEIAEFATDRGGFLILDEIYQGLHLVPAPYASGLQVSRDMYVLNSFSKYFGMTGWRLGWLVVPEVAVEPLTRLAQNLYICPSTVAQYAAIEAFSDDAMGIHAQRAAAFGQRAQQLINGLEQLGFHIPVKPSGAFYAYVDVSHTGMDSAEFCWRLLEEQQVAVTPGRDFGSYQSDRFVRFAFTTDEASIDLGLERLGRALQVWRS